MNLDKPFWLCIDLLLLWLPSVLDCCMGSTICFWPVFAGSRNFDTPVSLREGSDCLEVKTVTPWGRAIYRSEGFVLICQGGVGGGTPHLSVLRAYSKCLLRDHS